MHDEGSSVLLVVYRSAFERLSIREGLAETLQYLFVGGRALQNKNRYWYKEFFQPWLNP